MKDLRIKIIRDTSFVNPSNDVLGINNENLQGNIICYFDEFVNGTAWLEIEMPDGTTGYLPMTKVDEEYRLEIKSSLLSQIGTIHMQLRITENENANGIPVFKSNIFYVKIKEAINATETIPDEYAQWIDIANSKIEDIDKAIAESTTAAMYAQEQGDYAKEEAEKVDSVVEYVTTTSAEAKEIAGTAESIAKGANQSLSFGDYATMISVFNNLQSDVYRTGQNILIITLNVPDLWVSDIAEESITYTYTTDEDLTTLLKEQGYIQVGHYKLSALETQKVDLKDYVKNTDYATSSKGGAIKVEDVYGTRVNSVGLLELIMATNNEINGKTNKYHSIVPANLDYAVGSVKASETQSGTAKMWTTTNSDGEVTLNISTEA